MRIIKYLFLSCEVPHNSGVEQILLEKSLSYSEASEELAREEAYNGEYSIVEGELEQGPATGIKLLWKNDNPTSEFAAQTIPLILTDYDFVDVYFSKANNDPTNWICHRLHIGYDGDPFHMSHIQNTSRASVISSRHTVVTTDGVEFGDGFYKYTSSNTGGTESVSMIPQRIYGIKGEIGQPIVPEDAPETYDDITVINGVMTIYGLENDPTQSGNVLTIK